jgi:neutral amino acid transport system permease protein
VRLPASPGCSRAPPPIFGIGDAFGALAAGLVLGVVTEWSTLVIDPGLKTAVGFVVLVIVLMVRPQGIFGKAKAI